MKPPKVYLDTTVLKFSATKLPRFRPRQKTIRWGGQVHEVTVHDLGYINPNDRIEDSDLRKEADLLPKLAELGESGHIEYVIQMETLIETLGLPNLDSETGRFYGAPCKTVEAPITYGRIVFRAWDDTKEMQFDFLKDIHSRRFVELQRMTGAYQGASTTNRNQLLDAFHLWCAEHNGCDYFLTLDFKLIRILKQSRKKQFVKAVRPSELLQLAAPRAQSHDR